MIIKREDRNSAILLTLQQGKVNALDLELCAALTQSLEEAEKSSAKAIILTGSGTTFSAGVDLFRLLQGGQDYVFKFVPALTALLDRLFLCPKPVVAALNGNAIAGGCVIACACDYKIAVKGDGKIGVPEVLVGVPFPPSAFEIVRFAANQRYLQEIIYFGRYYSMEEGLQRGLVDEIVAADKLFSRASEIATKLGEIPVDTFRLVKRQLREPYHVDAERSKIREEEILKVWSSERTHGTIRAYLKRTLGK